MKKSIIMAFMLSLWGALAVAQGWHVRHTDADPLLGRLEADVYSYTDAGVHAFHVFDWSEPQYALETDGQFDMRYLQDGTLGARATVGLYDADGQLVEKFEMWLDAVRNVGNRGLRTRNMGSMSNPRFQKARVNKIFKHLQGSSGGYVRFVVPRFERDVFDLCVPCFNAPVPPIERPAAQ